MRRIQNVGALYLLCWLLNFSWLILFNFLFTKLWLIWPFLSRHSLNINHILVIYKSQSLITLSICRSSWINGCHLFILSSLKSITSSFNYCWPNWSWIFRVWASLCEVLILSLIMVLLTITLFGSVSISTICCWSHNFVWWSIIKVCTFIYIIRIIIGSYFLSCLISLI